LLDVKKFYFCAHKGEARVYIEKNKLLQTKVANIYANENEVLTITGMGKASAKKVKQTFKHYNPNKNSLSINFGIAGCSDQSVPKGTVFDVGTLKFNKETIYLGDGASCHSFIKPQKEIFDGFLCDMESFFITQVMLDYIQKENIKVYKVVSDHLKDAKIPTKNELNEWIEKLYYYEYSSSYGS